MDMETEIEKLKRLLKFARDNMSFESYPPDDEAEFKFCDICDKPDFHHAENCKGVFWLNEVNEILR
jgi:hypothetical protein